MASLVHSHLAQARGGFSRGNAGGDLSLLNFSTPSLLVLQHSRYLLVTFMFSHYFILILTNLTKYIPDRRPIIDSASLEGSLQTPFFTSALNMRGLKIDFRRFYFNKLIACPFDHIISPLNFRSFTTPVTMQSTEAVPSGHSENGSFSP
jgi:hypothetical protein